MRVPAAGCVGIALTVAGLAALAAEIYWFSTRTFMLLDEPVSLTRGLHLTREFRNNLRATYSIDIQLGGRLVDLYPDCPSDSVLNTQWTLAKDGERIEEPINRYSSDGRIVQGTSLGSFDAEKGRYQLDLDVLSDASCLNRARPRLRVAVDGWDYSDYRDRHALVLWFSLLLAAIGFVVGLQAVAGQRREKMRVMGMESLLHSLPPRGWSPLQSLRTRRYTGVETGVWESGLRLPIPLLGGDPTRNLPTIGLALPLFLFPILVAYMVLYACRPYSRGLMVRALGPRTILTKEWGQGLAVRIDAQNRWYLNSESITPSELSKRLWMELGHQPVRVVCFDADPSIAYAEAIHAMDIIRGVGAQVILLPGNSVPPSARAPKQKIK